MGKFSAPGATLISLHHAVIYSVHTVLVWEQAEWAGMYNISKYEYNNLL